MVPRLRSSSSASMPMPVSETLSHFCSAPSKAMSMRGTKA